jgi:hypothetical protein
MFMRYLWGYTVGHGYTHDSVPAPPEARLPRPEILGGQEENEEMLVDDGVDSGTQEENEDVGLDDDADPDEDDLLRRGEDEMIFNRSDVEGSDEDGDDTDGSEDGSGEE